MSDDQFNTEFLKRLEADALQRLAVMLTQLRLERERLLAWPAPPPPARVCSGRERMTC